MGLRELLAQLRRLDVTRILGIAEWSIVDHNSLIGGEYILDFKAESTSTLRVTFVKL